MRRIFGAYAIILFILGCGSDQPQQKEAEPRSDIIFDVTLGQSLGTNRVGPGPNSKDPWYAKADYAYVEPPNIVSFDKVWGPGNETEKIDSYLEHIHGQSIRKVADVSYNAELGEPNSMSTSPFISSALSRQLVYPGQTVHLTSLANGGERVGYFLPDAEPEDFDGVSINWWNGSFVPFLDAAKDAFERSEYSKADIYYKWLQGEENHTLGTSREEYRDKIANFYGQVMEASKDRFGAESDPVFVSYQLGVVYAPEEKSSLGNEPFRVSEIALAQLDLGISDEADLRTFITAPPSYAFSFSHPLHLDQPGYHALQSMLAYVAAYAEESSEKLKPLYVDQSPVLSDNGQTVTLHFHIPLEGQILQLGIPDERRFFSVPEKPDAGITLYCDGSVPDIVSVALGKESSSLVIKLSEAWDCPERKIGIAYETSERIGKGKMRSYYQGWQRAGRVPDGEPYHLGVGSNIYVVTDWLEPHSRKQHTLYASHQLIEID